MLEFYNSLDWVFQTTIILFLVYLLCKWFGGVVTALLVLIHPVHVIIFGVLIVLINIATSVFCVWSVFKLLFILL
ncbi:hypothetical protein MZD04_gp228 [Pseudomonas phage Psa21]|uniref:Uncharacterized protein n=1 Tax=Pseudomonas phage Psa21 TaxID=2530023 RepID=A0A481W5V3_9CAUD|nr:hypothetical protein MZD04_gp228 [Pseudomonas phage Psa21]QBJ02754.1 hypothetical protein PSA21_228 [Pseudomonas phage Psa21]